MSDELFSDKEALIISDAMGEPVITFLEVDEGGAKLCIFTCDGLAFMLMPDQIKAVIMKLQLIDKKESLQ